MDTEGLLYPIELTKGEFKAVQDFRKSTYSSQDTFPLLLQNAVVKVLAMRLGREPSSLPVDYPIYTSDSMDNASASDVVTDERYSFTSGNEGDGYGHLFSDSSFRFA